MINYDKLAEFTAPEMVEAVRRYIEDGKRLGSFLENMFIGNLFETVMKADDNNLKHIRDWLLWLQNEAPDECWGYSSRVHRWKGLNGYVRDNDYSNYSGRG